MPYKIYFILFLTVVLTGCSNRTPEEEKYIDTVEQSREEKNNYMQNDPSSPFNQDERAVFSELNYYEVDPAFVFRSRLYEYARKDTVIVLGTKGEERKTVKFGYVELDYSGKSYKINVYKGVSRQGIEYYSIWFTDKTTGKDTYGVGRYIDFEYNPDTAHIYTVDFNLAYNPYCAYSSKYSCAIPTKEDHLDLLVEAGEKNFH